MENMLLSMDSLSEGSPPHCFLFRVLAVTTRDEIKVRANSFLQKKKFILKTEELQYFAHKLNIYLFAKSVAKGGASRNFDVTFRKWKWNAPRLVLLVLPLQDFWLSSLLRTSCLQLYRKWWRKTILLLP